MSLLQQSKNCSRHPSEGWGPGGRATRKAWIPAFAGMTNTSVM